MRRLSLPSHWLSRDGPCWEAPGRPADELVRLADRYSKELARLTDVGECLRGEDGGEGRFEGGECLGLVGGKEPVVD